MFAKQDILTDPPFSRLDLVICRNLLIYLEPDAQEKCIALFHYALREGGYLFLGGAESPGRHNDLFASLAHNEVPHLPEDRDKIIGEDAVGGTLRLRASRDPGKTGIEPAPSAIGRRAQPGSPARGIRARGGDDQPELRHPFTITVPRAGTCASPGGRSRRASWTSFPRT